MEKKIRSFDGTHINYEISKGRKDAWLVFIHGAGGDLTAWRKERYFFHRKGLPTVAIDLRGHGKSDRPDLPANYRLEDFAKDVHTVIRHEKIKNFIIVGHCLGGMIAIMFHKLFPALARAYVLIDTTYKAPMKLKRFFKHHPFFELVLNHLLEHEDLRKKHFSHVKFGKFVGTGDYNVMRIFSDITHTSLRSWIFTFENLADFDGIKTLKGMKKHVLIIEGGRDSIFGVLKARKIRNLVKHSELDIIPEANHIIVLNNPKKLEEDIYRFITTFKGFG